MKHTNTLTNELTDDQFRIISIHSSGFAYAYLLNYIDENIIQLWDFWMSTSDEVCDNVEDYYDDDL